MRNLLDKYLGNLWTNTFFGDTNGRTDTKSTNTNSTNTNSRTYTTTRTQIEIGIEDIEDRQTNKQTFYYFVVLIAGY